MTNTQIPDAKTIEQAIDGLLSIDDFDLTVGGKTITRDRRALADAITSGQILHADFFDDERIEDPDSADAWASRLLLNDGPWWVDVEPLADDA